jgi:hypothetical protein
MTLTEVVHRAGQGTSLAQRPVCLTGQVTEILDDGAAVLARWVPTCCSAHDRAVEVELVGEGLGPVGSWVEVEAVWVEGSGEGFRSRPRLAVSDVWVLDTPAELLEA